MTTIVKKNLGKYVRNRIVCLSNRRDDAVCIDEIMLMPRYLWVAEEMAF